MTMNQTKNGKLTVRSSMLRGTKGRMMIPPSQSDASHPYKATMTIIMRVRGIALMMNRGRSM
jgi:hypothetical protein